MLFVRNMVPYSLRALVANWLTVRNMTFALQNTDLTYNGKAQKPTPVVTYGSKTLKNKTDYDAIYENEQSTDAGVYSVTIRLKGNFSGEQTLYYRIKQLDLSKLTVQIPKQNYSGNAVTPDISTWIIKSGSSKVTVVSGCGLIAQNWTNNVEVTANASVTLAVDSVNKNFMPTSSKKVTFSIVKNLIKPEKMRVKLVETGEDGQETFYKVYANGTSDLAADYTGGCIDPGVTVYDRETGKLLIAGKDYKVEYLNDKEPTDKAMIRISGINGYGGSMMVYYKINGLDLAAGSPVISGAGIVVGYTPYTTVTLFTSPDPAKVTVSTDDEKYMVKDDSYTYDGTQKKPYARVIYKGDKLTEGKDYTLKYVNNVNAGTATVQVIGKGKYRGTVEKNFFICPVTNYYLQNRYGAAWTEQFKITGISPTKVYVLENRAAVPKVTVTVMGKKLVLGKDYTVYMRLNDGSNGVLSVCGIGNYKGLNNSVEFRYRFK